MRNEILGLFFEAQRRAREWLHTPYARHEVERLSIVTSADPEDIALAKADLERRERNARAVKLRENRYQRDMNDIVGYRACPICGGAVQVRRSGNRHVGICSM
jgi:hypothetical protein